MDAGQKKQRDHADSFLTVMSKRTISGLPDADPVQVERSIRPRLESKPLETARLSYPNVTRPPVKQTLFQQPTQIITFSYTPSRELEFTDSAMRYYVQPPIGSKLSYGYDRWIRRPDEKPRIDSLLKAYSETLRRGNCPVSLEDISVVAWRGVMTRENYDSTV